MTAPEYSGCTVHTGCTVLFVLSALVGGNKDSEYHWVAFKIRIPSGGI